MKDWQLITLTVLGGLAVGYVAAKGAVAYVSQGAPMPFMVGLDPTTNFTSGATTAAS